jgi:MoxR-like ATPase
MTEHDHQSFHGRDSHGNNVLWQVGTDVVESIERFGIEPTYDLQTEDDPHNFIANGFVVHNCGKSEGVMHAVERVNKAHGLSLRLFRMDCATVTDSQKWFGRREVDKAGTRYEKSDFILAVERGDVILLDELTRLHPTIHNGVMSLLDGSNSVHLSDLNVTVQRHPETVFIATANIGVQYGGTHRLDAAMRERFPYSIERPFPPADVEPAILASRSGCDMDATTRLVRVASKSRDLFSRGELRSPVSTRTLVYSALLVAAGMTEKESLRFTAEPMYDPDANGLASGESERAKFRAIVQGILG